MEGARTVYQEARRAYQEEARRVYQETRRVYQEARKVHEIGVLPILPAKLSLENGDPPHYAG